MKVNKIDKSIVITGLIVLGVMECVALANEINGSLFTIVVGIIGLTIGVALPIGIKK